jgi:hypothetical protein
MARNFDWRTARTSEAPLFERWLYRYADTQCVGAQAWMRLLESLNPQFPREGAPLAGGRQRLQEPRLAAYLNTLRSLRKRRRPRRLFIAYHQADIVEAKRLAHLANMLGMAYWLEAYDSLRLEPGLQDQALAGTLTAAAIEMGLLNCSHAVVVARAPLGGVDWGAYQVARAREHVRLAGCHAYWLDHQDGGFDLAGLTELLHGEAALWRWLQGQPPLAAVPAVDAAPGERRLAEHRRVRALRPLPGLREREAAVRGQLLLR